MKSLFVTLAIVCLAVQVYAETSDKVVGVYYADWARYRKSPYKYDATNLSPIVSSINMIYYGFSFFCPPSDQPQPYWAVTDCSGKQPFDLTTIDPSDAKEIGIMNGYKSQNSNLKVIAAIGGWTFPSSFFSAAVKTDESRTAFINSIKAFTEKYKFDGINIDWEYPCSQPRHDTVKITCTDMKDVTDQGGDCPSGNFERGFCTDTCADGQNLLTFLTALKQALPNLLVSIAQSASPVAIATLPIKELDAVLTHWNLMNYDFFVSDIASQNVTAPNQNLFTVESLGVANWSAANAIDTLIGAGATPAKIVFGVAYYGHSYYVPGITDDSWQAFNLPATIQGECCGPFKSTYGAKYGQGSQQCGTYMFSEIEAAGFETYFDKATASMIGYLKSEGKDNYTPAGTWMSYLDTNSVKTQVEYAMSKGLGGAFSWDISMDTISGGEFTYELTKQMSSSVNGNSFLN